jgi:hypothetical protein
MAKIDLSELRRHVAQLEGKRLETLTRHRPFTVEVTERGFVYTPLVSGKPRLHRFPRIQLYLDEYAQSVSLHTVDYHEGKNSSYILALIASFTGRHL